MDLLSERAARRAFSRKVMHWAFIEELEEDQAIVIQNLLEWEGRLARAFTLFDEWYKGMQCLKAEALKLQKAVTRAQSMDSLDSMS